MFIVKDFAKINLINIFLRVKSRFRKACNAVVPEVNGREDDTVLITPWQ